MSKQRAGLGKGLSALLGDDTEMFPTNVTLDVSESENNGPKSIPVEFIQPGKFQPRTHFNEDEIAQLAASIKEQGILQPLLLRIIVDDEFETKYEIIAGERRWRAAQMAGLHNVPALIHQLTDQQALEIALIENIQRQDLSALEEALGYQRLMDEFNYTQEDLAKSVGKSRSHIANLLRLLVLPAEVKAMLDRGQLSAGHARALLSAPDPVEAAKIVIQKGYNVRQTEQFVKNLIEQKAPKLPFQKDPDTMALEEELATKLGVGIAIKNKGNKGTVTIKYSSLDELDNVISLLSSSAA